MNETQLAYNRGVFSVMNGVLESSLRNTYGMADINCKIPIKWKCLNLLLEAINTWDCNVDAINFITKKQYNGILFQIENLERL